MHLRFLFLCARWSSETSGQHLLTATKYKTEPGLDISRPSTRRAVPTTCPELCFVLAPRSYQMACHIFVYLSAHSMLSLSLAPQRITHRTRAIQKQGLGFIPHWAHCIWNISHHVSSHLSWWEEDPIMYWEDTCRCVCENNTVAREHHSDVPEPGSKIIIMMINLLKKKLY